MSVRRVKQRDRKTGAVHEFWIVDVTFEHADGREERVRKVSPVQTRRGAEQYERDLRDSLLRGTHGKEEKPPAPTLEEFAKEFLTTYAEVNNKPSEAHTKHRVLRLHVTPELGKKPLDAISARDVEAYKAKKLKEKLSAKSINNHLAVLRKLLNVAVEWNVIEHAPRIKPLRSPLPEVDFLDFDEAHRLVEAAEPEWRAMIVTALHTGLRMGELLALRWEDVDLIAGRLLVRRSDWCGHIGAPKSGKPREIPLNSTVLKTLKQHRHLKSELVFCRSDGHRLTYQQLFRPMERACKFAGLRRVQWHVLRHTFASHLVMRGVPLKAVQELMGHATIQMTMRYSHLTPDVRRDAVEVLTRAPLRQSDGKVEVVQKESP